MKVPVLAAMALALGLFAAAQAPPRVTYRCDFPASVPAWVEVTVAADGAAAFSARQQPADAPESLPFTASPALVSEAFAAAQSLHRFTAPVLESKTRVAFTGTKTLAFDDGAQHGEQSFNFTTQPVAAHLAALFQKTAATGEHALVLRRTMRYDRLGALEELEHIEADWKSGQLAEPQLLAPVLRQVAADTALMQPARDRAQSLLQAMAAGR